MTKTYKAIKDLHISRDVLNSQINKLPEEMLIELTKLGLLELVEETPQIDLNKPLYLTEEPKLGEVYFFIHPNGVLDSLNWDQSTFDTYAFKANNCYPTKEHGQKAMEIIEAVKEFKQICRPLKMYSYYFLIQSLNMRNDKDSFCESHPYFSRMADRLDLVLLQHLV